MVSHQANANAKDKIAAIYSLDTSPVTGLAVYGDLFFIIESFINLSITDLGWAPLATITWGSPYTLFFLAILVIVNLILLFLNTDMQAKQ